MDQIVGQFYIDNNKIISSAYLNYSFDNSNYRFYEVIRTEKGILLFLDDHIERLKESLSSLKLIHLFNEDDAHACLYKLVQANNNLGGNIKLLCKETENKLEYSSYYIPHYYPEQELYETGVKLKPYVIERNQPNIKQIQVNENIKKHISAILKDPEYFEVLLINNEGYITEGSKSNFFLIKGNNLYSAPESLILKGITRKYVLKLAHQLGFKHIEKLITLDKIAEYDAAFICGTSPKVLPVREIKKVFFDVKNPLLISLIKDYNMLLKQILK